jgi:hypothetical protein
MPRKKRKKIILGSKTGRSISTKEEEEEEEYKTQTLFIIDFLSFFLLLLAFNPTTPFSSLPPLLN